MRKILRLFFVFPLLLLVLSMPAIAQERTVSGTVVSDAENAPLEGVTVTNKNTKKQTLTNAAGYYSIAAEKGHVLVFTNVGFGDKEITVGDALLVNQKLSVSDKDLGEVIVTAYGINRNKKSLGYSTPKVDGDEVTNTQRENFLQGLAGRVPGLSVNATSGDPGASSQIVLRGFVSIGGDNSPLIVIDGLPIDNSTFSQSALIATGTLGTSRDQDYTNRAQDINPNDIETYTILKGPEATALYGNLGASGAIVITTKKGKIGKGSVSYNNSFRIEKQINFPEVQQVYSQGSGAGIPNTSLRTYFGPKYADGFQIYDNIHNFFETGFAQKHNVVFEGGTTGFSYRWSNELSDNKGTIPTTRYKRFSTRVTAVAALSPKLNLVSTFSYSNAYNKKANKGTSGYLMGLLAFPSRFDVREYQDEFGNRKLTNSDIYNEVDNPFWDVNKNLNEDRTNRMLANTSITFKPAKWLNVVGTVAADISVTNGITAYHGQSFKGSGSGTAPTGGRISTYEIVSRILNGSLVATATQKFGDFNGTFILGSNFTDNNFNTNAQLGEKFYDPNFYSINNTLPTTQRTKLTINRYRGLGVFSQAVLGYKTLLYLTVSGRMDASSRLLPNNPYFFYPSGSLAFNFSDLASVKEIGWISSGKLRASMAYTGKEPRAYYATLTRLVPVSSTGGGFNFDLANGGNDDLKPEYTRNFEAGLEMKFLKDRVGFDFTFYDLHSFDQIINPRLSYGSGSVLRIMNGGEVVNKGIELQLTGSPIRNKDVSWDIILNFARNRGTVVSIAEELPEFYDSDAWLQNGVRSAVYPGASTGSLGGWVLNRNDNGDLLINPTNGLPLLKNSTDFYPIGDRTPDFTMGLINSFKYKNLSLSFLLDLRKGGDVYNATEYTLYTTGLSLKTLDREIPRVINGVLNDGLQNTANPTINTISVTPYYNSSFYSSTTNGVAPEQFVEKDINTLRLRDVTLQYAFGKSVLSKVKFVKSLDVFLTATDVFLLTNYSGIDPDSNGNNPSLGGMGGYGIDLGNMGRPLGFNMGLRLKL